MSAPRARLGLRAALLLLGLGLAPGVARACAVCGGGNPANRFAFFVSTMVLSLLPLGLFLGGFLWLRSRLRERLADEFSERDAVPAQPPAGSAPRPATTTAYSR
jgi:hypothetical protein